MLFLVAVNLLLIGFVHDVSSTPCLSKGICGAAGGITESVSEKVQSSASSASSASSSFESSTRSMMSSGSCSSGFDEAFWVNVFGKCSSISEIEKKCYLKWLASLSSDQLSYFTSIADYLTVQEALSSDIVDFVTLQKDIASAYDFFNTKGIYNVEIDLVSKTDIFQEYVSKLSNTLKCLNSGTPLYNILAFSVDTDVVSLPCTIGLLNTIIKSQETYFASSTPSGDTVTSSSSSSTTKSVSSSSGGSSVSLTQYESILQAANIQEAEYQLYLSYLSDINSDKICLFTDLINFLNKDTQVLTAEMILDFTAFEQVIQNAYKSLVEQQCFVANANWCEKEALLAEIESQLSSALTYLEKDCSLYKALSYCLENDHISYLPLFVGLSSYVVQQQSSFFAASGSSSSTISQSAYSSSSSSSGVTSVCAS